MRKPTIKSVKKGVKGNKWTAYNVMVDGRNFHHQNRTEAYRQYKAAKRVYAKLKEIKKKK